jgi:hypothetical protein
MSNKVLVFLKSGGLLEVLKYISIYLSKKVFFKSETVFFYLNREGFHQTLKDTGIVYKTIDNINELQTIKFDRINTLSCKEWFDKGSQVIIGFSDLTPISYLWVHFHYHIIHGVCKIRLPDNQCWIGPGFVDKTVRRKGILKSQIIFLINNISNQVKYVITSARAKNVPSIRSLNRLEFKSGLTLIKYFGVFSSRKTEFYYENDGESIFHLS